jgi:hypothetical protein
MTAPGSDTGSTATEALTEPPLSAAEALASEGRFLDAIDVLTDANRAVRDPGIEARLVVLRNAAFEELDRSPTPSPWLDESPVEPGEGDMPALDPGRLTPEAVRASILRCGCAYLPGLIPAHDATKLVEGIERGFDAQAKYTDGAPPEGLAPWFVPFEPGTDWDIAKSRKFVRDGGGIWAPEAPRVMFDFLENLERTGLRSLIGAYLGERPAMTLKKWTLRRVPVLPHADWHQDGAFLGDDIRTINLWLSLSHCGDDAPGLELLPRRLDHVLETGTEGAFFPWSAAPAKVDEAASGTGTLSPIFEPGDALLFDELFLHRTATHDGMTRERYAVETWFFAPSLYPEDQITLVCYWY